MRNLFLRCDFTLGDLHMDTHLSFGVFLAPSSPDTECLNKPCFSVFSTQFFPHLTGNLWQG